MNQKHTLDELVGRNLVKKVIMKKKINNLTEKYIVLVTIFVLLILGIYLSLNNYKTNKEIENIQKYNAGNGTVVAYEQNIIENSILESETRQLRETYSTITDLQDDYIMQKIKPDEIYQGNWEVSEKINKDNVQSEKDDQSEEEKIVVDINVTEFKVIGNSEEIYKCPIYNLKMASAVVLEQLVDRKILEQELLDNSYIVCFHLTFDDSRKETSVYDEIVGGEYYIIDDERMVIETKNDFYLLKRISYQGGRTKEEIEEMLEQSWKTDKR